MNSYSIKPENRNDRNSKSARSGIGEMICHNQTECKESSKTNTGSLSAKQNALKLGEREKKKVSFSICHIHLLIPNEKKKISEDILQVGSVI